MLILVLCLTLCACAIQHTTAPTGVPPTHQNTTSADEAIPPVYARVDTTAVNIQEMTTDEVLQLSDRVFSGSHLPSNLTWQELVSISHFDSSIRNLVFLVQNVDHGVNISGATVMSTSLPLENLVEDNIQIGNLPQWLSCMSACFERSYGYPIHWSMWADSEEDSTLRIAITHHDPSLLYEHIAEYTGHLMEAYPALPVFKELPQSATAPDFLMDSNDSRLLKVGNDYAETFLVGRVRLHIACGEPWCEFTSVYGDPQQTWFTPLKNLSLPIFSTEFMDCDEETLQFLWYWTTPVVC